MDSESVSAIRREGRREGARDSESVNAFRWGEGAPRARGTTRVEAQPVGRGMWGEAEGDFMEIYETG